MFNFFRKYFIPHDGNDYTPHILQKTAIVGMLVLIICTFVLANIHTYLIMGSHWLTSSIIPAVVVDLTNTERKTYDAHGLMRNDLLDEAARLKAKDMADKEYFAHNSPSGLTPWHWFRKVGYPYVHAGENLAVHFTDSDKVIDAWMDSPTHKANIIDKRYTEIGIGTARGTYEGVPTLFVVQMFGAPMPKNVADILASTRSTGNEDTISTESDSTKVLAFNESSEEVVTEAEDSEAQVLGAPQFLPPPEQSVEPTQEESFDTHSAPNTLPREEERVEIAPSQAGMQASVIELSTSTVLTGIDESILLDPDLVVGQSTPESTFIARVLTQPNTWLSVLYFVIATMIMVSLLISIAIEWKIQRPMQVAYGALLLFALSTLLQLHMSLTDSVLIL